MGLIHFNIHHTLNNKWFKIKMFSNLLFLLISNINNKTKDWMNNMQDLKDLINYNKKWMKLVYKPLIIKFNKLKFWTVIQVNLTHLFQNSKLTSQLWLRNLTNIINVIKISLLLTIICFNSFLTIPLMFHYLIKREKRSISKRVNSKNKRKLMTIWYKSLLSFQ